MSRRTLTPLPLAITLGVLAAFAVSPAAWAQYALYQTLGEEELKRKNLEDPCYAKYFANRDALMAPLTGNERALMNKYEELGNQLFDDYKTLNTYARAYKLMNQEDKVQEISDAKDYLQLQLKYMPYRGESFDAGGAGGWERPYACRIQDWVSRPVFKSTMQRAHDIHEQIEKYKKEVQDFIAKLENRGVGASAQAGTGVEDYSVFLADNRDVLVGQADALKRIPLCQLAGWGLDCKKTLASVPLINKGPNFDSFDKARDWYCEQIVAGSWRVVPLTGGRDSDAKFSFGGDQRLGTSNAPRCPNKAATPTPPTRRF